MQQRPLHRRQPPRLPVKPPRMMDVIDPTQRSRILARLTPKEKDVARLVALCLPNKEIARQMHTTEQVIKNRCKTIYDLTGCDSKLELAVWLTSEREEYAACDCTGL